MHQNQLLLKAVCSGICEASKIPQFYPEILNDFSMNTIISSIMSSSHFETKSFEYLSDCFKYILSKTKLPIKYLVASSFLKIIESDLDWKEKEEANIITAIRVIQIILKSVEDQTKQIDS